MSGGASCDGEQRGSGDRCTVHGLPFTWCLPQRQNTWEAEQIEDIRIEQLLSFVSAMGSNAQKQPPGACPGGWDGFVAIR
ncbi:MAG: hypothetical protein AAFY46_06470, partial [Planctomycetota bacterium]